MYIFFWPLLFLPVVEIIGFFTIGAGLGLGLSLLWLFSTAWFGFHLLKSRGKSAWARAEKAQESEVFARQDLFDGICIFIASLLLIFPGFISDFIAVPFLAGPMRHWLFDALRKNPDGAVRKFTRRAAATRTITIEGEYKRMDDE